MAVLTKCEPAPSAGDPQAIALALAVAALSVL
jgi:hypothetical protein